MCTTTNLEDFGKNNLNKLSKLIDAYINQGLPEDFEKDQVNIMMNTDSHSIFFTNSDFQTALLDHDGKLKRWYNCPQCGNEGFSDECELNDEGCNECK